MRVDHAVFAAHTDLFDGSDVPITEERGRKMCDKIVEIAYDDKPLPPLCYGRKGNAPDHARTTKSIAFQMWTQVGTRIPYVLVAKHRDRRPVGIPRDNDLAKPFVMDQRSQMRLQRFPRVQKSAVRKPNRLAHAFVRLGGKIKIPFPVQCAV